MSIFAIEKFSLDVSRTETKSNFKHSEDLFSMWNLFLSWISCVFYTLKKKERKKKLMSGPKEKKGLQAQNQNSFQSGG